MDEVGNKVGNDLPLIEENKFSRSIFMPNGPECLVYHCGNID